MFTPIKTLWEIISQKVLKRRTAPSKGGLVLLFLCKCFAPRTVQLPEKAKKTLSSGMRIMSCIIKLLMRVGVTHKV